MASVEPSAARQAHAFCVVLQHIHEREREVLSVLRERPAEGRAQFPLGVRGRDFCRHLAKQGETPLADHPLGLLGHDTQMPANSAVIVRKRAVGKRVIGLLGISVPLEEQQQRFIPCGRATLQDLLDPRTDLRPNLRPHVS
jgi:hypothetical protein